MTTIRILTAREGFVAGAVVEMADADALHWLSRGEAEAVAADPVSVERQVPIETAVQPPVETAVATGKVKTRKR